MSIAPPSPQDISGLVLAGGAGRRLGGSDKGLVVVNGRTLVSWTLARLAPQVGTLAVSANRHLDAYRALGVPVWPDALPGFAGPLAGIATGLYHCPTPFLAVVPCDTPCFPTDLVARLARHLVAARADVALAATESPEGNALQAQPVFCLLRSTLLPSMRDYLAQGGRKVQDWMRRHPHTLVPFAPAEAFAGANTAEELARLEARLSTLIPLNPTPRTEGTS